MPALGGIVKGLSTAIKASRPFVGKAVSVAKGIKKVTPKVKATFSKFSKQIKAKNKGYSKLKEKPSKLQQFITRNKAISQSIKQYKQKKLNQRIGNKNPNAKKNFLNRVEDQGLVNKAQELQKSFKNKAIDAAESAYNRRLILQQMGLLPDNLIPGEQQRQEQVNNEYIRPYLKRS